MKNVLLNSIVWALAVFLLSTPVFAEHSLPFEKLDGGITEKYELNVTDVIKVQRETFGDATEEKIFEVMADVIYITEDSKFSLSDNIKALWPYYGAYDSVNNYVFEYYGLASINLVNNRKTSEIMNDIISGEKRPLNNEMLILRFTTADEHFGTDGYYFKIVSDVSALEAEPSEQLVQQANMIINAKPFTSEKAAYIENQTTMVPLRAVAEAFGYFVDWNGAEQKITLTKGNTTVILHIGDTKILVNGMQDNLSVPPTVKDGTTFLPVRKLAEILGIKVDWESNTKTAIFTE